MRRFYLLGGAIILFICVMPLKRKLSEYQVQTQGDLIDVVITKLRPSVGCKIRYDFDFEFNGAHYSKTAGCHFHNQHRVGELLKMRHIDGQDIFLFPTEDVRMEFVAFGSLLLFGIFCLWRGFVR
jgi:hypothetical protein